jgi:signal transduction histidine kinase
MSTSAELIDRVQVERLAEEQAALRRVATLVATGAPSSAVFAAVAHEVARVMHLPSVAVCRYDDDGAVMTVIAAWSDHPHEFQPGTRWPLDGPSMVAQVLRTGSTARIEDYAELPGTLAAGARRSGLKRTAGAPIIVDGVVWGVIATSSPGAPFPEDLEDRLGEFTELVATAIANSQAREELTRLAEEQAALRRVATLVAQGASPAEVFATVSAEVARMVPSDGAALTRFEADDAVTALGGWTTAGGYVYVGERYAPEGTVSGLVFETRRPSRIDSYAEQPGAAAAAARAMGWRSSVGVPITVEGRLWGVLAVVSTTDGPLPHDTERRLAEFTELVATAIANAESREALTKIAEEQAALRRVATLIARGVSHTEVLDAVAAEVGRLLGAEWAGVHRYDADGGIVVLSSHGNLTTELPVGARPLDRGGFAATIWRTGRSDRIESFDDISGYLGTRGRELGVRSAVGAPITLEGRLWGVIIALWQREGPVPVKDAEGLLVGFTELLASAIANSESRAELDASRARIVATADATRRRIERDLHDGAQQQLVSLALDVRATQTAMPAELGALRSELSDVAKGLTSVMDGLREIALGIHPAILAEGGLGPALKGLARHSPVPVELEVGFMTRLPEPVEVAAYYVVSEALTNVAKYACASVAQVDVEAQDGVLRVAVRDDGLGGADPSLGSGLLGLKDRAEAIGGTVSLESPPGAGTSLLVELPLDQRSR